MVRFSFLNLGLILALGLSLPAEAQSERSRKNWQKAERRSEEVIEQSGGISGQQIAHGLTTVASFVSTAAFVCAAKAEIALGRAGQEAMPEWYALGGVMSWAICAQSFFGMVS